MGRVKELLDDLYERGGYLTDQEIHWLEQEHEFYEKEK